MASLIKPSHRGLLHKELGVPQGKEIPEKKLEQAAHSDNAAERKRAVFAENFGHGGSHELHGKMSHAERGHHHHVSGFHTPTK